MPTNVHGHYYKEVDKVYETTEYSMFHKVCGNRPVEPKRVVQIMESIQKIGFLNNPIIVDRNFGVYDGQGRLEACKQLRIPVRFVFDNHIKPDDIPVMNMVKVWNVSNYIGYYADIGNENYINFRNIQKSNEGVSPSEIATAVGFARGKSLPKSSLVDGKMKLSEADKCATIVLLEKMKNFKDSMKMMPTGKSFMRKVLYYVLANDKMDIKWLKERFDKNALSMKPLSCVEAARALQDAYNNGKHAANRVRIIDEINEKLKG